MHPITVTITAEEYYRLVATSGIYNSLRSEMLPELFLALICLLLLILGFFAVCRMLSHSDRENKQLQDVIEEMHREEESDPDDRLNGKTPGKWLKEAVRATGAESWESATAEQRSQAIITINKRCGINDKQNNNIH